MAIKKNQLPTRTSPDNNLVWVCERKGHIYIQICQLGGGDNWKFMLVGHLRVMLKYGYSKTF